VFNNAMAVNMMYSKKSERQREAQQRNM